MPPVEILHGLNFIAIGGGSLTIGHRPGARAIRRFPAARISHVVTVLSETECPHVIEAAVRAAGLAWIWLPLGSTKNLPARGKPEIGRCLDAMIDSLAAGGRLYLHCSAGLHRTGMIAAALLFRLGCDADTVRAAIAAMRPLTARDMGEARFEWAASFAARS